MKYRCRLMMKIGVVWCCFLWAEVSGGVVWAEVSFCQEVLFCWTRFCLTRRCRFVRRCRFASFASGRRVSSISQRIELREDAKLLNLPPVETRFAGTKLGDERWWNLYVLCQEVFFCLSGSFCQEMLLTLGGVIFDEAVLFLTRRCRFARRCCFASGGRLRIELR